MGNGWDGTERRIACRRERCDHCPLSEDGTCENHQNMEAKMLIGKWAAGSIVTGLLAILGSIGGLYMHMGSSFGAVTDKLTENKEAIVEVQVKQNRVLSDLVEHSQTADQLKTRVLILEQNCIRPKR